MARLLSMLPRVATLGLLLLAAAGAPPAAAHDPNLVSTLLGIGDGRQFTAELRLKGSDLDRIAGTRIHDLQADRARPDALAASEAAVRDYLLRHAVLRGAGGEACPGTVGRMSAEADHVTALLSWDCSGVKGEIVYSSDVLTAVEPAARQIVILGAAADAPQAVLTAERTEVSVTGPPPSLPDVILEYTYSGIEHIFIGYDHIAFIIGVLLWASRVWPVIKVATSFTVAHSITLSLAVLGVVDIPGEIIEPLIAASIVFVAVENFVSRDMERRWKYTFVIGLIHGFGFAGVLREFGLPDGALATALVAFNLGVEIGQVAIIAVFLPALLLVERALRGVMPGAPRAGGGAGGAVAAERNAPLIYALSGATGLLGVYWLVERTLL